MPDHSIAPGNLWLRIGSALKAAWRRVRSAAPRCLWFCWVSARGAIAATVALATIASGIAAAIAAYYARETARVVFEIEQERLGYEKNKYSSDMYQRYVDFIRTAAPITPCLTAVKNLSDDEFRTLWKKPAEFDFKAASKAHASLAQCLQAEQERRKYKADPEAWTSEQTHAMRYTMVIWLNQLDAYLLLYQHKIGNQGILCENILTLVASDTSPLKDFLVRMNDEGLLGPVANVKSFIAEYGTGNKKCPSPKNIDKLIPEPLPEHILRRLGELVERLGELLGIRLLPAGKDAASN
jgi:hypothetical protein